MSTSTARAMVLEHCRPAEGRPLHLRPWPVPAPGPGEITMEVLACGVCRTDLHTVEGDLDLPRLPTVPGHQVIGRVTALGPGADSGLLGRVVGVAWMAGACGNCPLCQAGSENLCPQAQFTGLHRNGGFADQINARADFSYPLPAGMVPAAVAPLLCAGVIGYRALRLAGALEGGVLGMWGFGASAHITIQVARHRRCEVAVVTRSAAHRRLAIELGASWTGSPGERPPAPLDHAIIFSPAGGQAAEALSVVRPGGTVVCAGVTMSDLPTLPYALIYGERKLCSVANATRKDARELLALAAAIPIRPRVETLPLSRANEALERVKHSQIDGALVLLP